MVFGRLSAPTYGIEMKMMSPAGVQCAPKRRTAGQRMIESARQALAFVEGVEGKGEHGCEVHLPNDVGVRANREGEPGWLPEAK